MGVAWLRGACAALLLAACQSPEAQGQAPRAKAPPAPKRQMDINAEDYVGPTLPKARVLLKDAFGGVHGVEVEVAATPESRTRGLMWRKELRPGQGMLFVFPEEEVQGFWMKNTLIPLDMLFIDSKGLIVGIIERAEPHSLTQRSVGVPSRYVLEVSGGWCQSLGLKRGGTAQLQGLEGIEVLE
jgi:hypothetical protein